VADEDRVTSGIDSTTTGEDTATERDKICEDWGWIADDCRSGEADEATESTGAIGEIAEGAGTS